MRLGHRYRRQVEDDPIRQMHGAIGLRDNFRHAVSTVADTVAGTLGSYIPPQPPRETRHSGDP